MLPHTFQCLLFGITKTLFQFFSRIRNYWYVPNSKGNPCKDRNLKSDLYSRTTLPKLTESSPDSIESRDFCSVMSKRKSVFIDILLWTRNYHNLAWSTRPAKRIWSFGDNSFVSGRKLGIVWCDCIDWKNRIDLVNLVDGYILKITTYLWLL